MERRRRETDGRTGRTGPRRRRTTNSGDAEAAAASASRIVIVVVVDIVPRSPAVTLVDDSRLRRYNCGLRSETRGNPRERRFLRALYVSAGMRASAHACVSVLRAWVCAKRPVGIHIPGAERERKREI